MYKTLTKQRQNSNFLRFIFYTELKCNIFDMDMRRVGLIDCIYVRVCCLQAE